MFSNRQLRGCSIYNRNKVILREMVESFPDVCVFWPVPKGAELEPQWVNHERIKVIELSRPVFDQYREMCFVDTPLVRRFSVDNPLAYCFDLVLCDKVRAVSYLKSVLGMYRVPRGRQQPVVNLIEFAVNKKEKNINADAAGLEHSMMSGLIEGWNVYETPHHEKVILKACERYFSPSVMDWVRRRTLGYMGGVDVGRVLKFVAPPRFDGTWRINFANRVAYDYKINVIFRIVELVYSLGHRVEFVITTPSKAPGRGGKTLLLNLEEKGVPYTLYCGLPQEEFYKIAATCHFFISALPYGEFCAAYLEQILLGQIGLLPDRDWLTAILPKEVYPFYYKSEAELLSLFKKLVQEYSSDALLKQIAAIRKFVSDRYDLRATAKKFYRCFLNLLLREGKSVRVVSDMVSRFARTAPERFTFGDFREFAQRNTRNEIDVATMSFMGNITPFDFVREFYRAGYRSRYDPEFKEIRFERRAVVADESGDRSADPVPGVVPAE